MSLHREFEVWVPNTPLVAIESVDLVVVNEYYKNEWCSRFGKRRHKANPPNKRLTPVEAIDFKVKAMRVVDDILDELVSNH